MFRPIGRVESPFGWETDRRTLADGVSWIAIDPAFADGLKGIEAGMRLLVLFHFHRSEPGALQQHPRGDASRPKRGVFALRSPRRPVEPGAPGGSTA